LLNQGMMVALSVESQVIMQEIAGMVVTIYINLEKSVERSSSR
jgi:hypothetical protein